MFNILQILFRIFRDLIWHFTFIWFEHDSLHKIMSKLCFSCHSTINILVLSLCHLNQELKASSLSEIDWWNFFRIFFHHFKQNYFLILFVFLCVGRPQCREDKCHLWDQNAPDVTPPKVNKPHNLDKQSCDIEKIAEILRGWDN